MSQNRAEGLDEDEIGGDFPPEEPLGVDEYGTTAGEERFDEPLDERIAREEPDVLPVDGSAAQADEVDDTFDDAVQEHEAPVPAEEAALHITDDPT
jgi:hypothetical protein